MGELRKRNLLKLLRYLYLEKNWLAALVLSGRRTSVSSIVSMAEREQVYWGRARLGSAERLGLDECLDLDSETKGITVIQQVGIISRSYRMGS